MTVDPKIANDIPQSPRGLGKDGIVLQAFRVWSKRNLWRSTKLTFIWLVAYVASVAIATLTAALADAVSRKAERALDWPPPYDEFFTIFLLICVAALPGTLICTAVGATAGKYRFVSYAFYGAAVGLISTVAVAIMLPFFGIFLLLFAFHAAIGGGAGGLTFYLIEVAMRDALLHQALGPSNPIAEDV